MIITPERREPQAPEPPVPEMVERVAKILWDQRLKLGGGGRTLTPWPACPEAPLLRENAREIIAVMTEPTDDMRSEGFATICDDGSAATIWFAMVMAALR